MPGERKRPTATAVRLRPDLHEQIVKAAAEREVSVNWMVNRAIEDFLPRLIPIEEFTLTRSNP